MARVTLLVLLLASQPFQRQTRFETEVSYGERILFSATIYPFEHIVSATVTVTAADGVHSIPALAESQTPARFEATLPVRDLQLSPFSTITYSWHFVYSDREASTSPAMKLVYLDEQFDWHRTERGSVALYWVEGDGETRVNMVAESLEQLVATYALQQPEQVIVALYPSQTALRSAFNNALLVGHAQTGAGLISASSDRQDWMAVVRHELMHLMIHAQMGDAYAQLPAWLNEGLSTLAEDGKAPDFVDAFDISELCSPIPFRGPSAEQAYAQSASITGFVLDEFGVETVAALLQAYQTSNSCEDGVLAVMQISLHELQSTWRDRNSPVKPTLGPWLLLALPIPLAILANYILRRTRFD